MKRTTTLVLAIVATALASIVWAADYSMRPADDTKPVVKKRINVRDFDQLELESIALIRIEQSNSFGVEVEAKQEFIDATTFVVKNGKLVIDTDDKLWKNKQNKKSKSISGWKKQIVEQGAKITIRLPKLTYIGMDGVGNISLESTFETPSLVIDFEGVGNLNANNLKCTTLKIEYDGVGNISMKGSAQHLTLKAEGVGNCDLSEMIALHADVSNNGIGSTKVYASESIKIKSEGMGTVTYYGNPPQKQISKSGIGRVKSK